MTEKRFTVHTFIEDYEVGEYDLNGNMIEILDNGNRMTYKECCDLLNELHEENQRYKRIIDQQEMELANEINDVEWLRSNHKTYTIIGGMMNDYFADEVK